MGKRGQKTFVTRSAGQCGKRERKTFATPVCKPVWETRTKDVCYTVCKPVWETRTKDVCYTVCKPVWETRTKQICYTVCKPVWETRSRTVCYNVRKPVYETRTREVCRTIRRPVHFTRTVEVCTGHWDTHVEEIPGPVVQKCVQEPGCWNWDPCRCCCVFTPGASRVVEVQCPPRQICRKVWVPSVEQRTINCVRYECETVTEQVPYTVCYYTTEQRQKGSSTTASARWSPSNVLRTVTTACATWSVNPPQKR